MTDYCTKGNVKSRFKKVDFTSATSVTSNDVLGFISIQSAFIDSMLDSKYQTPITGTSSLLICRMICELLVASDVLEILPQSLQEEIIKATGETAKMMRDRAYMILDRLTTGSMSLTDATAKTDNTFYSYNDANSIEPTFEKDTEQW